MKWDPFTAANFTTVRGAIEAADTAWVDVLKIDIEGGTPARSSMTRDDPHDSYQARSSNSAAGSSQCCRLL